MTIKICDAVTGAGKSSAAINYMNDHPEMRFVYITPYLEEAKRIKSSCPDLNFFYPPDWSEAYGRNKTKNVFDKMKDGRNITTTHSAFMRTTDEMIDIIHKYEYTLIIDENLNSFEKFDVDEDDMKIINDAGYISWDGSYYNIENDQYAGRNYKDLFDGIRTRDLVAITEERTDDKPRLLFFWIIHPEIMRAFKDVYILTYMFEGQSMRYYFDIHDIQYRYAGVELKDGGRFEFSDDMCYIPGYIKNLKSKIHIIEDDDKLNDIGRRRTALSMSWFEKNPKQVVQLRKNISNVMINRWRNVDIHKKLWCTYKCNIDRLKGKGYIRRHLSFNERATNAYKQNTHLVYAVNPFMNVGEKMFYNRFGVNVDEDAFALSSIIQWTWRSAIRDGKDIWMYIPSKRMRSMLNDWIDDIQNKARKGGDRLSG